MSNGIQQEPAQSAIEMQRRAFILGQLADNGVTTRSRGELNKKIPAAARRALQLTNEAADVIRRDLVEQKYLLASKDGRTLSFAITEAGRALLAGVEVPAFSRSTTPSIPANEETITEELREGQKAFLLLQLFGAKTQAISQADANRIPKSLVIRLGLKPNVANYRRAKLAAQGYLKITRVGRTQQYSLLPDGVDYLASGGAKHLDDVEIPVKGKTLNSLVTVAREFSFHCDQPGRMPAAVKPAPSAAELEKAVLAVFQELLRERHGRTGLVPIHEVRQSIAERFGPRAARHDVLDEAIKNLWRTQRIGLEGISDLSTATQKQLDDSIEGVHTTLFYLEVPRDQPVVS
jgi:hypothetical protein